jgi:hypothetical protein
VGVPAGSLISRTSAGIDNGLWQVSAGQFILPIELSIDERPVDFVTSFSSD